VKMWVSLFLSRVAKIVVPVRIAINANVVSSGMLLVLMSMVLSVSVP